MKILHQTFFSFLTVVLLALAGASLVFFISQHNSLVGQYQADRALLAESLTELQKRYGNDMLDALGEAVINPYFLHENDQVYDILSSFLGQGGIKAVYIFDKDWRVAHDGSANYMQRGQHVSEVLGLIPEKIQRIVQQEDNLIFTKPLSFNDEYTVGAVSLVLNQRALQSALERLETNMLAVKNRARLERLRFTALAIPLVMILSMIVSYLAARHFSRPINKISREVKALEGKHYTLDLPCGRKDEIGELSQSIKNLAVRLQANERFKDNLITSVSHELRTPLTSVRGFTKVILRDMDKVCSVDTLTEKQKSKARRIRENLSVIESESKRLTRLISSILDLNKIESGAMVWRMAKAPLSLVLEKSLKSMEGLFATLPDVELVADIPPDLPEIPLDQDRIEQVLINLLSNAAKFTEKGSVTVRAALVGSDLVQVDIMDTGIGVPEPLREKIFERFQQADEEGAKNHEGTGLGLAISKEIIHYHGGRIWVTENTGGGSRFSFQLPLKGAGPDST